MPTPHFAALMRATAPSARLPRIPEFNPSRRIPALRRIARRRAIDLGDKRRIVVVEEMLDARKGRQKRARQFGKRCRPDNHQQADAVPHDRVSFVRLIANTLVVGQRDPAAPTDLGKPHVIGRVGSKMIDVALDGQTARFQNLTKLLAKVAVREIAARQAARS